MSEEMDPKQLALNGEEVGQTYRVTITRQATEKTNDGEADEVTNTDKQTKRYTVRGHSHGAAIDEALARHGDVGDGWDLTVKSECKS